MKSIGSSSENYNYDVFLSFRGKDTRTRFTDHLYKALKDEGLSTYRDDEEIERGEMINTELDKGIHHSRNWIIIFSKDYASSRWCLDELVMILECKNSSKNRLLLPVFYHVNPSDLRRQSGCISDAFRKYEERMNEEVDDTKRKDLKIKIKQWRRALTELADLSGMPLQKTANGYETKFIQKIVNIVKDRVDCNIRSITPHLVGITASVNFIDLWLRNGSTEVEVLALHGIGGVGKTTIAKYAYNMNTKYFDGASFLENTREYSEQSDGLLCLQRQLLSDICRGRTPMINNLNDGIRKIQNALRHKKLLIVLDDADLVEQLNAIIEMREWFSPGSKIIITTRNVHVLKPHEHCETYAVKTMDHPNSLELFSWHAFRDSQPPECYIALSERIVKQCEGLPLALEVLGASLHGKKVDVWRSAIEKLEIIPHYKVQKILQISYESLQDDHDRDLFLDIACFFIGEAKSHVVGILDGCNYYTIIGIENLTDRCLLKIDKNGKLKMHQLIQSMGREIIRQQYPRDPGQRSRLWHYKDSLEVLRDETGTQAIEGLKLDMSMTNKYQAALKTEAFAMMKKMRLLRLNNVQLIGGYKDFPKKLKWLCWHRYPFRSLPTDFPLSSLVAIDMQYSKLQKLWNGNMLLGSLKFLNLSHCHDIVRTPDFANIPALEELILEGCVCLVEIDESIDSADGLTLLNLKDCKLLKKLPDNFCRLKLLETLIISGCSNLGMLPVEMRTMESIKSFRADGLDFGNSSNTIQEKEEKESWQKSIWSWLSKSKISPQLSLRCLPWKSLTRLSLSNCNLHDDAFPKNFCFALPLDYLDLSGNPIRFLPDCFKGVRRIERLYLMKCNKLQALENLPNIKHFTVLSCPLLEKITFQPGIRFKYFTSPWECRKLVEMGTLFNVVPIEKVDLELINECGICEVESMKKIQLRLYNSWTGAETRCPIQGIYNGRRGGNPFNIFYPGSSVPIGFTHEHEVSSVSVIVSQSNLRYLNICIVYKLNHQDSKEYFYLVISNRTQDRTIIYAPACYGLSDGDDHVTWLSHWKFGSHEVGHGDEINISVFKYDKDRNLEVKEVGVYLGYKEKDEGAVHSAKRQKIQQTFDGTSQHLFPVTTQPWARHGTTGLYFHGNYEVSIDNFMEKFCEEYGNYGVSVGKWTAGSDSSHCCSLSFETEIWVSNVTAR